MMNLFYDFVFATPQNATTIQGMLQYLNRLTDAGEGGGLGIVFIVVISSVLFLMMRSYGNERALAAAFVLSSICAFFLFYLGLVGSKVITITVILAVIGFLLLIKDSANYEI